jgi:hypothetical protein
VNVESLVGDRLRLGAEAVWLPYTYFDGEDNHWLRGLRLPERGSGANGVELEATASYQIDANWSVGVGLRYWRMTANVEAQFITGNAPPTSTNGEAFQTQRLGGFLQVAYRFD